MHHCSPPRAHRWADGTSWCSCCCITRTHTRTRARKQLHTRADSPAEWIGEGKCTERGMIWYVVESWQVTAGRERWTGSGEIEDDWLGRGGMEESCEGRNKGNGGGEKVMDNKVHIKREKGECWDGRISRAPLITLPALPARLLLRGERRRTKIRRVNIQTENTES